jgi:hypothetical protein
MQAKTSEKNESASEVRMPSSNQKEIAKDSQISPL